VVIIVSDAGVRGEAGDERMAASGGGGRWGKDVVDIRSVLGGGLLGSACVTQIGYVSLTIGLFLFQLFICEPVY
jgi:cell cycle checkpoint protein